MPARMLEPTTAPARDDTPPILIELDTEPTGGFIHDRFDVQLRGRVAAGLPIEALELVTDEQQISRIDYGQPHRAPATTLPDGTPGRERMFQFNLPRLQAEAEGVCNLRLRALSLDGHVHEESFALTLDPTGPEPVRVVSGAQRAPGGPGASRPPIIAYAERAVIDADGELLLHGWALAMNPIVTVQAFLADQRLPAARLGAMRDDVAAHYPGFPNARLSGFTLTTQLGPNVAGSARYLRVQAISRNGFSHEVLVPLERTSIHPPRQQAEPLGEGETEQIGAAPASATGAQPMPDRAGETSVPPEPPAEPKPHDDPRREIRYFCDEALFRPDGTLHVVGWAVCAAGLAEIVVALDGQRVGVAELGRPRPDVGEEFADNPAAKFAGFRFEQVFPEIAEGEHQLSLLVRNAHGDERSETRRVHATKPVRPAPADPAPEPAAETRSEFRFELDGPQVLDGRVLEPVTGRLTIEGWVLARSGVAGIHVYLDDQRLGEAHYGLARQDVGAAFPEWDNALRSGYAFHCPPRALRDGEHVVKLTVRAKNGQTLDHSFRIDVSKSEQDDQLASIRRRMSCTEAALQAELLESLGYRPNFHLVLWHRAGIPLDALRATMASLDAQGYDAWQATVLAEDPDAAHAVRRWLAEQEAALAARVAVVDGAQAAFDDQLVQTADHDATLFGLLCPGDLLGCDALGEIALSGGLHRQPDFLYADEARPSPASKEREPYFKPDFSPDLLLSTNYIGRPWFAAGSLLRQCALTPRSLFAAGEYDLLLRCTEQAQTVHHVHKLLAQRGPAEPDDDAASRAALARAAERRGFAATVKTGCLPGTYRLQRLQPAAGKVSIIIPTCAAHGHIETCIRTLRETTAYRNYEIVCIDNIPAGEPRWKAWLQENADRIVDIQEAFNWSHFNNRAAEATDGEYLLFLNDDIEITQPDWLDALLEHAQRPEVGIVGPQLLYPGGKVQHAGMFLGAGIGRHAFRFVPGDEPGYFGLALTQRNVIAVTGACMLMRRSFFEAMGGFEEAHSVINNDLDFCLRAHQAGKLTVFTPHASLIHHELASRERIGDDFDTTQFDSRWRTVFAAGDPYFNPRLSRYADDYRPDDEAVQTVLPGHPLFERAEIQRILVVKLDHIGDVITALPAIRRLKALFPNASISMLAGRTARSIVALEPAIDTLIEFDFFHARSQLGERELAKEDFEALREQLAPHRFDLAIDLRKHLSTRDVLRYTGARFLAGYDYVGQFPFLDIALEWDGDRTLQRKRSHVVDDLLALVEAVNTASTSDRSLLAVPPAPIPLHGLPELVRGVVRTPRRGGACRGGEHHQAVARGLFHRTDRPVAGTRPGECAAGRRPGRPGAVGGDRAERAASQPGRVRGGSAFTGGSPGPVGTLSAVHWQRQRTQAYRRSVRGADDRDPLGCGGCGGMGAGRASGRGAAAQHGL